MDEFIKSTTWYLHRYFIETLYLNHCYLQSMRLQTMTQSYWEFKYRKKLFIKACT